MSGPKIAWPELMRLGLYQCGLSPDTFWNLTPAEFSVLVGADADTKTMTREWFQELSSRFPDGPDQYRADVE